MQGAMVGKQHAHRIELACRVLVIDSDRDHTDRSVLFLERLGHQVRRAYRVATALDIANQFLPHVVLIDMTRPSTGLAVATALRERRAGDRVHLVALTDWVDVEQEAAIRGAGFDALLVKPLDREALEQMLTHWCDDMRKKRAA